MRVKRVLSNNAVLAEDHNKHEVVALGRGVGFGVRASDQLDPERVEQVFTAGGSAASEQLAQYLTDVPLVCVRAAARIADLAHERMGVRVSQAFVLPLADHLAFAMRRRREDIAVEFPLRWEVSQLYPRELAVGREAVGIAKSVLQVDIDDDEAVAIAMHLVNAQFTMPEMNTTMQMTETIARIFSVIEASFGVRLDTESMNAARFVTHLRYVVARIASGKQIDESDTTFFDAMSNLHPEAMACAVKLRYIIELAFQTSLTTAETAYLALHIARLVADVRVA